MAGKKFGSHVSVANTNHDLFSVATGKVTSFTVNVCNTNNAAVTVRLSIGGDAIEHEETIPAYGTLERTGLIAEALEVISVRASAANVVFRAYGIEE